MMYFLGEVGQSPHQRPWAAQFPLQGRVHPSGVRGLGGCDPLGGHGEDKGAGHEGAGESLGLCPVLVWPSLLPWPVRGLAAWGEAGATEQGGGWGCAWPALHKAALLVAGWDSSGHSACPSTSSVCTGTKSSPGVSPQCHPAHPTDPMGPQGPQAKVV